MKRNEKKTNNLGNSIAEAIHHLCSSENDMINKTIQAGRGLKTRSVEPGVEIIDSLEKIIEESLHEAKKQGCDFRIIIKGIIIGAFRSSEVVRDGAHKTIDHIVKHIITHVIATDIDLEVSIRALIEGIIAIAQEKKLNIKEAVSEAGTSIILAIRSMIDLPSINPGVRLPTPVDSEHWKSDITEEKVNKGDLEDQSRRILSQPIRGVVVELKEHSLESR